MQDPPRIGSVATQERRRLGISAARVDHYGEIRSAAQLQVGDDRVVYDQPYVASRSTTHPKRWVITAWVPSWRPWHNPPVPCIHADPQLPDCLPGQTVEVRGILSFYEGSNLEGRINYLERVTGIKRK